MPAHEAPRLQQFGRAQRLHADEEARAEADAAGELVGLRRKRGADFDCRRSDRNARSRLEIEPGQQGRIGRSAIGSAAERKRGRERLGRIERHRAGERIGGVDRLDLDQRGAAVLGARHRAHGGGQRDAALRVEEGALRRGRLALAEDEGGIAAEDLAARAREPIAEACRHRGDAGDRHDAERDAGDEHIEPAHAGTQFPQSEAQGEPAGRGGEFGERDHTD